MKILPVNKAGDNRTGRISSTISKEQIIEILGFAPNVEDDPDKVENSWGFTVDGVRCGIWDYKSCQWSTFGPHEIFQKLFGSFYTA
jgi:hypothetical protein